MTGFGRTNGTGHDFDWVWEVKSVNNKSLDIRVRLPALLDGFDITLKKWLSTQISRGTIFVNLTINRNATDAGFIVNEAKLQALIDIAQQYDGTASILPATLDGLLRIKGVIDEGEKGLNDKHRSELETSLKDSLADAVSALVSNRAQEGARMHEVLCKQIIEIEELVNAARIQSKDRVIVMQKRFTQQLEKLQSVSKPIDDEKLAQEIALLAVKADVMEELDRLDSHIVEAKTLLDSSEPIGRRLDFLCQEFNREANTLCAKSGDTKLTKIGLDIKTLIDQFREQIQNIE